MPDRYVAHKCELPSCDKMTKNRHYCSQEHGRLGSAILVQRSYTRQELEDAVLASMSLPEVLVKLGIPTSNGGYNRVLRDIQRLEISRDHFTGQRWNVGHRLTSEERRERLLAKLTHDSPARSGMARLLVAAGLREWKCYECERTKWRGQPVPLQCDHVDGNRRNNTLDNLKLLCGNCHMQTSTWGRKPKLS